MLRPPRTPMGPPVILTDRQHRGKPAPFHAGLWQTPSIPPHVGHCPLLSPTHPEQPVLTSAPRCLLYPYSTKENLRSGKWEEEEHGRSAEGPPQCVALSQSGGWLSWGAYGFWAIAFTPEQGWILRMDTQDQGTHMFSNHISPSLTLSCAFLKSGQAFLDTFSGRRLKGERSTQCLCWVWWDGDQAHFHEGWTLRPQSCCPAQPSRPQHHQTPRGNEVISNILKGHFPRGCVFPWQSHTKGHPRPSAPALGSSPAAAHHRSFPGWAMAGGRAALSLPQPIASSIRIGGSRGVRRGRARPVRQAQGGEPGAGEGGRGGKGARKRPGAGSPRGRAALAGPAA